jgi:hypothetical protein
MRPVQVRASNLNELIYKQGQAGVTKASVTLVFDNSDRELSPHGYDHYKKITVTRQARQTPVAAAHRHSPPAGVRLNLAKPAPPPRTPGDRPLRREAQPPSPPSLRMTLPLWFCSPFRLPSAAATST